MAHALSRIEGAEPGTFIALNGDIAIGNVSVSSASADRRSGDYGYLITNDGVTASSLSWAWQFDGSAVFPATGNGKPSTTAVFAAVSYRVWLKVKAYPSTNGLEVLTLVANTAGTKRSIFTMSTTGVLTLDGVAGSTALALNTWYEVTGLYSSAATGSHSVRLRADGALVRSQEFTNVTPTANGTILRLLAGKTALAGSHTIAVDDLAFEGAALVASIDYPLPGHVIAMDGDGDGALDGVWAVFGAAQAWQATARPFDGSTTDMAISGAGSVQRRQSFTIEDTLATGIVALSVVNGVQFCSISAQPNAPGNTASHFLIAASTNTAVVASFLNLTTAGLNASAAQNYYASMKQLSPFTSVAWTLAEMDVMVNGILGVTNAAASVIRVTTVWVQVDYEPPPAAPTGGSASLPSGGSTPAPEPGRDVFCASVIFDPGGMQEFDLSSRLSLARPIRQERDILLRDYRASDADLEFRDTDELFIETNPFSFLRDPVTGEPNWFGKRVTVDLRMGQEVLTRFIGQVLEVQSLRGRGILKIADRFQAMFDRPLLANTVGRIVSTTGAVGLGPSINVLGTNAPVSGWYLGNLTLLNQSPATRNQATKCQTWTLTFTSEAIPDGNSHPAFFVTGSITGFDGEGQHGVPGSFVSKSGQIAINTDRVTGDIRESYLGVGPGNAPKGSTTSLRTVWRPTAGTTAVQAMRQLLLDWRGVGLDPSEIDGSLDALLGTAADQLLPAAEFIPTIARMSFDETLNLLAAVQAMALHLGCSFIEKANGNIGVASFMPRVVPEPPVLCHSADLMDLQIAHLPIYNEYTVEHAFSESNDKFTQGFASPEPTDNDSFERYDKIFPAPSTMQFRGYDASNLPWMQSIALALYDRYKDPRRIYSVRAKSERLAADLGDVFRIDSLVPTIGPRFTEPVSIDRNITGDLTAGFELVEVDSEIVSGECGGYLGLDTNETGLDDDCWGVF
jgi:hypothetical protein